MCTHHHGPRGQSSPDTGRSRTPDPPPTPPLTLLPARPPMLPTLLMLLLLALLTPGARGGNCWSLRVRNGRCTDLLNQKVSKEECCASSGVASAWSEEDLDAGTLFFWRVLGGGVPCTACKESCAGVQCGEGRRCVLRRGAPRCVCAPDCKARKARVRGPVCGTDGRSYTSVCRLRRRACRRKAPSLAVDYAGKCQGSCERVSCGSGRHCLLDQNLRPHCVRCAQRCPSAAPSAHAQPGSRQVCGADGVTYPSACHLREAACLRGRAIPEAYKGRCKQAASCSSVRCGERQTCLTEPSSGAPRCVTCSYRCPRQRSRPRGVGRAGAAQPHRRGRGHVDNAPYGPICGSNNHTYETWCHMLKDACATGFVIETQFAGHCRPPTAVAVTNTVIADDKTAKRYL